jgi:hypothetical protein
VAAEVAAEAAKVAALDSILNLSNSAFAAVTEAAKEAAAKVADAAAEAEAAKVAEAATNILNLSTTTLKQVTDAAAEVAEAEVAKVAEAEVAKAAKVAKAAEAAAEPRVITVEGVTQSQMVERLADLEFQRNLRGIPVQFIGNLKKDLQNISDEELKPYVTKHLEYFKKKLNKDYTEKQLNKDYTEKQLFGFLKKFQAWAAEAAEAATNEKKFSREDEKTLRDNLFIGSKGPFGWVLTRLTPLRRQAYFKKMTRIISAFIENPETKIEEKEENPALKKQYESVINILNKKTDTENKTFLIQILKEIKAEQKKSWTRKITDKLQDEAQPLKIMNMLKNIITENEMILFNSLIRESENQKNIPHMMNSRKNTKKVLNHITNPLIPLPPKPGAVFNLLTKINSHNNKNEKNEILDFLRSKIAGLYNPLDTPNPLGTSNPLGTPI